MEQVSERLVAQRVRNRIIGCLEYLAEGDEGIRGVGDCEYFNSFFDWVDDHPPSGWRGNSAMSRDEIDSVREVLVQMLAAVEATGAMSTQETIDSGWPRRIAPVAQSALDLHLQRGRFDEEHEEATPSR